MSAMTNPDPSETLRVRIFASAIVLTLAAAIGGGGLLMLIMNGVPVEVVMGYARDAVGVLLALTFLAAFVRGFPRIAKKVSDFFDQQAQIATLIVERNNAMSMALAAETTLAEAQETHAQEMSEAHRVHAMTISAAEDRHVLTLRRLLRERREEKRQQFAAWHKGYKILLADRDRALAQVESLQAGQDRKLLTKADDLTALIIAAINGDLNRVAVRAVVPLSNGAYRKWSENLQAQVKAVLATSVTAAGDPSAPPSSPTPQDTVVGVISTSENPVEMPPAIEGEGSEGTAPEAPADEGTDQPPDEAEVQA